MAVTLSVLVVAGVVGLVLGRGARYRSTTSVGREGADLYFTTYSPGTVRKVTYRVINDKLTFADQTVIARLPGADGIIFSPGGQLLIGAGNGFVYSVDPGSGKVTTVRANVPAFMLSPSPDGRHVYTAGLPGPLAEMDTGDLSHVRAVPLSGDDTTITGLAFGPKGTVLYTSSDPAGTGDIGTIDIATGVTRRLFKDVPGAHGAVYDPYTSDFITMGGSTILQLSGADPSQVVSEATLSVTRIDQGAVDGHGRVFAASNGGDLVLIDYSATHRVGSLADKVSSAFLATNLDDVAPLIGAGAAPTPTLARWWQDMANAAFTLAVLLLLVTGVVVVYRRRRQHLPRWDRRAQAGSGGR